MENQNNLGNQTQPIGQNSISQSVQMPEKSKVNYLIIGLVVLVSFTVLGFGAYFLGKKSGQEQKQPTSYVLPTPYQTISPTVIPTTQASSLPTRWSYKSDTCGVKFAIPPKEKPFYEGNDGRFWDFPRGAPYPNLLSKLLKGNEEYKQAATMYVAETEASGYISSAIVVSCVQNTNVVDNQGMLSLLNSGIQKYNSENNTERMDASKYTIQSTKEANRWNKKVIDIVVSEYFPNSGGQPITNSVEYTMLATPQYIYEVKIFGATTDSFVKEIAKKIFDNLIFE